MESQERVFMIGNSGGNRAINAAEDENYGEILKSGDNTLLKYKIFDGDGEILLLEGLPCEAVIKKEDKVVYRTPAEVDEKNIVTFKITEVLPSDRNDPYTIEFVITQDQDTLIFPSDDRINLYIYPSSLSVDGEIIKQTPEERLNEIVIVAVNDATQDFYSEVDNFRDTYNELIDTGVVQENINQKLAESESEYAPRLTKLEQNDADLTAQLAQKANQDEVKVDLFKKRDKSVPITLNDTDTDLLSAIQGGEGTSFELLSIPRDYSVTPEKTTFIYESTNLLNLNGGIEGYRVDSSTGELIVSDTSYTTDYLPIGWEDVTFYGVPIVALYDKDKNFLVVLGSGTANDVVTRKTISATAYFRAVIHVDYLSTAQLNIGTELLPYESFEIPSLKGVSASIVSKGTLEPSHFQSENAEKMEMLFDTTEAYISTNLLNLNGGSSGKGTDAHTGEMIDLSYSYLTDYIPIAEGDISYYGIFRVSAYDNEKQFISNVGSGTYDIVESRSLPRETSFIRANVHFNYLDTAQLNRGKELFDYEPHYTSYLKGLTASHVEEEVLDLTNFKKEFADKLERLLKGGSLEEEEPPHLNNIKILTDAPVTFVNWFHDGLFYGSYSRSVYTSPDGENWTEIHRVPTDSTASPIAFVIVSDTNRIIIVCQQGQVFISDEDGSFSNTPTFTAEGRFSSYFGQLKYKNVIGFNTYIIPQGVDQGQAHEVFISTDDGATFKKIFDSTTFDNIEGFTDKSRVHLHDVEYDPYSGRLYIWCGDLTSRTMLYSDDWGSTWKMAFPQGQANNATVVIATKNGIALGADTGGGGVGYVHIDRSSKINPEITIDDYEGDFWQFAEPTERFIATREWVDRENGIFLIPYIVEYDDNNERSAYLAYSNDGYNWHNIFKSPHKGHYSGFYTMTYGNGLIVGTYRNQIDSGYQVFIAEVEL